MEAKYKVGDILYYEKYKIPLLLEVVEVQSEFVGNMYILKRYGRPTIALSYKNFGVVHKYCRLAKPSELTLYGQ